MSGYVMPLCLFAVLLAGCSTSIQPKQTQDIPNEYIGKVSDMESETGFNYGWIDYNELKKYDYILLNPRLSGNMIPNSDWEDLNSRRMFYSREEDNKYVETYCLYALKKALGFSREFKQASEPGDKTLSLDFYIVKIVANEIIIGIASNALMPTPIGWMTVPIKLAAQYFSPNQGGSIAAEVILRDSKTGRILAVFVSKEKGQTALFDRNKFYAYASIRNILDIWAIDIFAVLDQIKEGKTDIKAPKHIHSFKIQDRIESKRIYKKFDYMINN